MFSLPCIYWLAFNYAFYLWLQCVSCFCLGKMPKKVKRVVPSFDFDNFVSRRAQDRFNEKFSKKKPVPVRGFLKNWVDNELGDQLEQIWIARHWEHFIR